MSTGSRPRIGILLSGRGSNFEAIARAITEGRLEAEIGLVFSNRPDAPGLVRARELGYFCQTNSSRGVDRAVFDSQVADSIVDNQIDLVCLAGYLRLLSGGFVSQFRQRILNIHPSLLPAFPGLDAQHQALVYGVKVTGCTVHLVDENLDSGPIVAQSSVPVLDDDTVETLSARILREEHRIYPEAIGLILSGKYRLEGRRVVKT